MTDAITALGREAARRIARTGALARCFADRRLRNPIMLGPFSDQIRRRPLRALWGVRPPGDGLRRPPSETVRGHR